MKRLVLAAVLAAALALAAPAGAAEFDQFGFESAEASLSTPQAGGHPEFVTGFRMKTDNIGFPFAQAREIDVDLPPGLLGNLSAFPQCSILRFQGRECPIDSQIGIIEIKAYTLGSFIEPLYYLAPAPGTVARLGFFAQLYPNVLSVRLRPGDYGVTVSGAGLLSAYPPVEVTSTVWAVPSDSSHDFQRTTPEEAANGESPPGGGRSSNLPPTPLMINPTRCGPPLAVGFAARSYQLPDRPSSMSASLPQISGCGLLGFSPDLSLAPTSEAAETGTGLDVELSFPADGLEHPNLLGDDEQKRVEVTLPEGVTVNPSQAVGLGVCSEADFERETASSAPNEGCPETAKIGNVTAKSPLLDEAAEGALYIAKPKANPFDSLIALYLVLKIPERGVIVKLAGKVEPDPSTGQLVTTFGEPGWEIPQLPVESFHLHFREGARSPLVTPPRCGSYESTARFESWGGQTVTTHPSFQITSGVNGGSCPSGTPPFEPGFLAGSESNNAKSFSPFHMRLTRRDGDQDLTKFSAHFPPGLTAKLAGVSQCSEAAIAAAGARAGKDELASPSCPASSEIGNVLAGAGVGQVLTYAEGRLYLAGPYKGAPISAVAIVPAVAGPFDVGTVVTRVALRIDPRTAQVAVDGSASDPIPHILAGIPLKVRDIRVNVDRPEFSLNPTSCAPFAVGATIWGGGNDVFSAADDAPVGRSVPYQAANCLNLGFKPRLAIRLKGGVRRGAHPGLRAVVTPRPGDANFSRAVVTLPRSAFLEQAHIRTICTRVQFAAPPGNGAHCPPGAQYGYARAWSPILDGPAQGPVFLRSSDNNLPDLVVALTGPPSVPAEVELSARIDSVRGGIRSTFAGIPDLPVSRFVLQMQGGKKGLIVNSRNLCHKAKRNRARSNIRGQNGRLAKTKPVVRAVACAKKRKAKRSSHRRARVARASAVR